jgi:hypothetical protein
MTTDKKLTIAIAALAVLGGLVFLQQKNAQTDAQAHSLEGASEAFPKVSLADEDIKKIDKVELNKPAGGDGGAAETIVLVKKGDEAWALEQPIKAVATASNVTSLLDNLKRLEVSEQIDSTTASYPKFGLTDEKALHATFYKGADKALELYFGENGSRGQMTRLPGKDGVYAVKGYSSFLYTRDAKGWRDKTIFKFEDKDAEKVTVENEHGLFTFDKNGEDWSAKLKAAKAPQAKDLKDFDKTKLESLLRAYKTLNAVDFGDDKKTEDVGLAEPIATLTIELKGGSGKHVLTVGDTAEGSNRWVMKNGSDQVFSVSSWAADWATGDKAKFQKSDEPAADEPPAGGDPHGGMGMPPGMAMPPQ